MKPQSLWIRTYAFPSNGAALVMESAHRTYLATQILSDQNTISYRNVARALKVHVNAAKRILYEFHAHENGKKPGSVHATYLLAGVKKPAGDHVMTNGHANGVDLDTEPIPSSPPPFTSSMLQSSQQDGQQSQNEALHVRTVTLIREEALEGMTGLEDMNPEANMVRSCPSSIR